MRLATVHPKVVQSLVIEMGSIVQHEHPRPPQDGEPLPAILPRRCRDLKSGYDVEKPVLRQ